MASRSISALVMKIYFYKYTEYINYKENISNNPETNKH